MVKCGYLHCIRKTHYQVMFYHETIGEPVVSYCCPYHLKEAKLFLATDNEVKRAYTEHFNRDVLDETGWFVQVMDINQPGQRQYVSNETLLEIRNPDLEDPLNRDFAQLAQYGRKA